MNVGVLGLVILPLSYLIAALLLYVIIRFGVKHGMRSYYADAAQRSGPAAGSAGEHLP